MMEFYEAYANYHTLMDFTEGLLRHAAAKRWAGSLRRHTRAATRPLKPFHRLTITRPSSASTRNSPTSTGRPEFLKAKIKALRRAAQAGRPGQPATATVRSLCRSPVLGTDLHHRLPGRSVAAGPRLRQQSGNHRSASELFIVGREIANGFSELNDAETRPPAWEQAKAKDAGDEEAMYYDADFIPRAGIRPAADRRLRHRHRPSDHVADRLAGHPRRHPLPVDAPG